MMRVLIPVLLAATVQGTLALSGLIAQERLIRTGTEVVLATAARDPRDLLRGHYVTLRLAISDLPKDGGTTAPPALPLPGAPVWVTLVPGADGIWRAGALSASDPDGLAIRGVFQGDFGDSFAVDFDIARYYAPRDRALALEAAMQTGTVAVILALAPDGRAALRGVVVDGVRQVDGWF